MEGGFHPPAEWVHDKPPSRAPTTNSLRVSREVAGSTLWSSRVSLAWISEQHVTKCAKRSQAGPMALR